MRDIKQFAVNVKSFRSIYFHGKKKKHLKFEIPSINVFLLSLKNKRTIETVIKPTYPHNKRIPSNKSLATKSEFYSGVNIVMDSMKNEDQITLSQVALYTTLSCIIVSLIAVLLYLTCSKRYKLNWFENNLLETAKENEENAQR